MAGFVYVYAFADMESILIPEGQAALHGGYKRGVFGGRATSAKRSSKTAPSGALAWSVRAVAELQFGPMRDFNPVGWLS